MEGDLYEGIIIKIKNEENGHIFHYRKAGYNVDPKKKNNELIKIIKYYTSETNLYKNPNFQATRKPFYHNCCICGQDDCNKIYSLYHKPTNTSYGLGSVCIEKDFIPNFDKKLQSINKCIKENGVCEKCEIYLSNRETKHRKHTWNGGINKICFSCHKEKEEEEKEKEKRRVIENFVKKGIYTYCRKNDCKKITRNVSDGRCNSCINKNAILMINKGKWSKCKTCEEVIKFKNKTICVNCKKRKEQEEERRIEEKKRYEERNKKTYIYIPFNEKEEFQRRFIIQYEAEKAMWYVLGEVPEKLKQNEAVFFEIDRNNTNLREKLKKKYQIKWIYSERKCICSAKTFETLKNDLI